MRPKTVVASFAVMTAAACLAGCGVVNAARRVVHDVEGNKATINSFTNSVKSGEGATFEATYRTTGSAPVTITYAAAPPTGLAFTETQSGSSTSDVDLIVNSSGEYSCRPPSSGASSGPGWSCEKLGTASAATENKLFDIYTPSHWVTFLQDFSLAAGLAGDKVTSSTMTVNGFAMRCVDFHAPGVSGTSTICTTSQGILGYVQVASDAVSFEITSYSATPAASLFALPPGATVTSPPTTTIP